MRPELGVRTPLIILIIVLLPAPFGPIRACTWPCWSRKVTSFAGRMPPKFLETEAPSRRGLDRFPPRRAGDGVDCFRASVTGSIAAFLEKKRLNRPATPFG